MTFRASARAIENNFEIPLVSTGVGSGPIHVLGIKPWKRWQIDCFLSLDRVAIHYADSPQQALRRQARDGGCIIVWAGREPDSLAASAAAQGAQLIRIEDGFLRSAGLGSNHIGGASLVIDPDGIYFDARRPSRLENLLQYGEPDQALLQRAARLREFLVQESVTKYNVGTRQPIPVGIENHRRDRRTILVPGQVENDASLRLGAPQIHRNLELLQRVREAEPQTWIIYKPHPDIEAGTRPGKLADQQILRFADEIARNISITALYPRVHAVHTMTSLAGFEALLRGVPVTTWGQPFYAGWGLTDDRLPIARRTRRISLDALVAAALLQYPLYADLKTRRACSAEEVAAALAKAAPAQPHLQRSKALRYARLGTGLLRSWRSNFGHG